METNQSKLRELASWYREQAERAGNPVIWEARLRTAEDLDKEADCIQARMKQRKQIR
jgi:hypothetical protein